MDKVVPQRVVLAFAVVLTLLCLVFSFVISMQDGATWFTHICWLLSGFASGMVTGPVLDYRRARRSVYDEREPLYDDREPML